jgi:orotidine-5'-phosphate decarboxylase
VKPLIVALDVETDKEALQLTRHLSPCVDLFKMGPVLFLKYGSELVRQLRQGGANVFLDLKFHDIPSVVARAVERAAEWGVYSATVHIAGGRAMLERAARLRKRPRLWGVTMLTSLDQSDLKALGIHRSVEAQVSALAQLAASAGIEGAVASVEEVAGIKRRCGSDFVVVTPGIRLEPARDDHKRAQTPVEAVRRGADFFVMGRPIVEAKDPVSLVRSIYQSLEVSV